MASQDMPPPGGFATINVERTLPKPFIRQGILFLTMAGLTSYGYVWLRDWKRRYRILKLEQVEHYIAAHPFLVAEQERKFLRHLRAIREDERELMKDHPGWKLGTLYGEPVFKTLPPNVIPPVNPTDYAAHRSPKEWLNRVIIPDRHQ